MDSSESLAAPRVITGMSSPDLHDRATALFIEVSDLADKACRLKLDAVGAQDPLLAEEVRSLLGFASKAPLLEQTAPAAPKDPLGLVNEVLDDRYRIDALVAEGGFGYVYRAEHLRWARPIAVKVIKHVGPISQQLETAFIREGALLNDLSRKTTGIVQSYDVGTWKAPNGKPHLFTVLEWLEGRTLAEANQDGPWTLERVVRSLAPVAQALDIAHANGVAHRDIKPSNIFMIEEQGVCISKLLDFGIAKVATEEGFLKSSGNLKALTAGYAAPEQFLADLGPTGPWTDVHALAVVCVELLLGTHPTPVNDVASALKLCSPDERPTPRTHGLQVSNAVEATFVRALGYTPNSRYPTAGQFWAELESAAQVAEI